MKTLSSIKVLVHRAGITRLLHRVRNRRTLTVAAFHRVLAPEDPRWVEADPAWTVSRELFAQCLDFFVRHYRVLSLDELLEARRDGKRLPDRSLLISFDDGWADTANCALPELERRGLPAVVFVVADAVGRAEPFWREALMAAARGGGLGAAGLENLWRAAGEGDPPDRWNADSVTALLGRLECMPAEERTDLLSRWPELASRAGLPVMISTRDLRGLEARGMAIGSHGQSHEPLDLVADPMAELAGSRRALARLLERPEAQGPRAFSFPHGRFREEQLELLGKAGYELAFTSEEHLDRTSSGGLDGVLGRVCIDAREISTVDGSLAPELLALWLFRQPIANGSRG